MRKRDELRAFSRGGINTLPALRPAVYASGDLSGAADHSAASRADCLAHREFRECCW